MRVAPTLESARVGNIKLNRMLSERLLKCHPKKTCFVLMGTKKYKEKVREEVKYLPLKFGDFSMLEKDQDVYLGDVLSSDGLSASVQSTVTHRLEKSEGSHV